MSKMVEGPKGCFRAIYSDEEIRQAWYEKGGQGNENARLQRPGTVSVDCPTEEEAIALTRVALAKYNMPSAATWLKEKKRFVFDCTQTSHVDVERLKQAIRAGIYEFKYNRLKESK